jgi:bis(5'-nucleosyl)-tetraphosphatase (symmetrical)
MKYNNRIIIIGDIHGCIEELNELIDKINLQPSDSIYFIGDLIDRGPDSIAVVKKCYELSLNYDVKLILGNHEEKFLRYLKHIENKTGLENQMSGVDEFPRLIERLDAKEVDFLKNAYYSIELPEEKITLLHGGISNQVKFPFPKTYKYGVDNPKEFKGLELITKVRYVTPEGKFVSLNEEKPEDKYWAEVYSGSFGYIYFGHQPFVQELPENFSHATGLDTGCVFGGWLSAVIIENDNKSFVSVKAKETYSVKH